MNPFLLQVTAITKSFIGRSRVSEYLVKVEITAQYHTPCCILSDRMLLDQEKTGSTKVSKLFHPQVI